MIYYTIILYIYIYILGRAWTLGSGSAGTTLFLRRAPPALAGVGGYNIISYDTIQFNLLYIYNIVYIYIMYYSIVF